VSLRKNHSGYKERDSNDLVPVLAVARYSQPTRGTLPIALADPSGNDANAITNRPKNP
jgi:hypothetical protein